MALLPTFDRMPYAVPVKSPTKFFSIISTGGARRIMSASAGARRILHPAGKRRFRLNFRSVTRSGLSIGDAQRSALGGKRSLRDTLGNDRVARFFEAVATFHIGGLRGQADDGALLGAFALRWTPKSSILEYKSPAVGRKLI